MDCPREPLVERGAGQVQARDAGVVDPRTASQQGLVVAVYIVGDAQARLEHVPGRGDFAIGRECVCARCVGNRFANEIGEEDLVWIGDYIGLDLRLPAQAVVECELVRGLPTVLDKQSQFILGHILRARFFHAQAANAGLLQVDEDRAGDFRSFGTGPGGAGAAIGAFDIGVALFDEVEKAIYGIEDVASIGKTDEDLPRCDAVPLDSGFDQVIALADGDVVEQLDAGVVIFNGNEEGHAKAIAVFKIHARIGKGPRGVGIVWAAVGTGAIFAGDLEAEFVDCAGG